MGVGEFADLKRLADLCAATVRPTFPTTATPYPTRTSTSLRPTFEIKICTFRLASFDEASGR